MIQIQYDVPGVASEGIVILCASGEVRPAPIHPRNSLASKSSDVDMNELVDHMTPC
jgi:hypothetical protein